MILIIILQKIRKLLTFWFCMFFHRYKSQAKIFNKNFIFKFYLEVVVENPIKILKIAPSEYEKVKSG